jgi:phage/plasmid-associated DNA primase
MPEQLTATRLSIIPKSKIELAYEYRMTRNTIYAWCKKIGIETEGGRLTPKQVKEFYMQYGPPEEYRNREISF